MAHWESVLKAEGLASLDGSYTQRSQKICYAKPAPRFGVHSAAHTFEFFLQCEEYGRSSRPQWPETWNLFAQGLSLNVIASRLGTHRDTIRNRVTKMRADMRLQDRSDTESYAHHAPGASLDVLEVFVDHQQKGK